MKVAENVAIRCMSI